MSSEPVNQKDPKDPRPLAVLIIEDNPDDAFLLDRHLKRSGFAAKVTRVETGGEMRAVLQGGELPDVILADYNLPQFSGPAALRILKSTGIDIPFIMMSGVVSEETAVESMRAGAQDYVSKQNLTRLVPAIERELKEASLRRHQRAAEEALLASEERFHRLVKAMPLGLLIGEASGRIVYANEAVERLGGYPVGDILSGAVTLKSLCPALREVLETLATHDFPAKPFEAILTTASGHKLDILLGISLLNPEAKGEDRQAAAFIADLSLQKRGEERLRQAEKLAVAGQLAASIAHEINNPLEAITNCLYLQSLSDLPGDARTYLEIAQKELDRVAQITVQTLRFYKRSTNPSATDLHELIGSVLTLLESRLRLFQIDVIRDFHEIPRAVAHEGEIRQVIANLLGNAIDALPKGGRIVLRTVPSHDWVSGERGIRVTVADNGVGMDAGTRSHIFEPFFSTKGAGGTGLGLWISQEIVDKHNGHLRVRSRQAVAGAAGQTVFSLFLPIDQKKDSLVEDAAHADQILDGIGA
jgi:signal transduction histidine kinase